MYDSAFIIPQYDTKFFSLFHQDDINIGLCLAQPVFYNNPKRKELLKEIYKAIKTFSKAQHKKSIVHLLSFNHNTSEQSECDIVLNNELYELFSKKHNMKVINATNINEPTEMLGYMKKMDISVCMRFHSIVFALMNKLKFVSLSTTPKNRKIVSDMKHPYNYNIPVDDKLKPISIDKNQIVLLLNQAVKSPPTISEPFHFDIVKKIILGKKTMAVPRMNSMQSFANILQHCENSMRRYFEISENDYTKLLHNSGPMELFGKDALDVSRLLSYIITGTIQNPYVWGLSTNMQKNNFKLYEAIEYIYKDANTKHASGEPIIYYPTIKMNRTIFANIDFVTKDDYRNIHRSGWAYAIDGLMNISAIDRLKRNKISLDTFVDRSFHWGCETLRTTGIIPYITPWAGIIHHTFDETHSKYNCVELFKNEYFIKSLEMCRGLIALSEYLAMQLRDALKKINMEHIGVFVVRHPMETVHKMFSIDKYLANSSKKIINIGAWLRNPYTIYQLQLINMDVQKCVLKGKCMDQYFAPSNFVESTIKLFKNDTENTHTDCICRPNIDENKYYDGLINMIKKNHESVNVIEHLSNDEYDDMLTENLVFLNLVDCSAVNTVLECIVRNTPIIVNRHPALEEVLGKLYPGFYDNLVEVALIVNDVQKISNISHYLSKLNKECYDIEYFVSKIQNILCKI